MDKINKYDYIFLATEDIKIKEKFIHSFEKKLKYLETKDKILYDYKKKEFLSYNKNIKGNIENIKIYMINIIILSKCIDILSSRTSGASGAFILSEGFRNIKMYYIGDY